ncbi:hypothetical protein DFQ01_110116 [Paenibacillus cellulosilyticus]|uniref:Uncharacterized protein n=1 Tax=Paenibacillus cellulosilyticus TaxID=375489 RepID=A0A2V2YTR5_9BACL|nr:hypothetical protein [Paenibacillus cellulosilyticus]PWW01226.1 hypothetical protein DFQ01_110116 [Paenibacillus cellulosilyticus]QKS46819.1 hypothetical protein HUB94_20260 [Paenibacillus cellulosilyticus]
MKWVLVLLLMTPIFLLFQAWDLDESLQTKLHAQLKQAVDLGTHDAALQVEPVALEQGEVRFEQTYTVFLDALQRQLKLDSGLDPLATSVWKDGLQVVLFEQVETGPFPRTYSSGPPYYYTDTLLGPSVVAIVKIKHPRYFGVSDDFEYVIGSSHEYKGY